MIVNLQEIKTEKERGAPADQEIAVEVDPEADQETENIMHLKLKLQKLIEDQVIIISNICRYQKRKKKQMV
jgi:hypothetical protein